MLKGVFQYFIIITSFMLFSSCKKSGVHNSSDRSVWQVKEYLGKTLKDPDSFRAIEWTDVKESFGTFYKYTVMCKYRAKNSFGGYTIEEQVFYLDSTGTVVQSSIYNGNK